MGIEAFGDRQKLLVEQAQRLIGDLGVNLRALRAIEQILAGSLLRALERCRLFDSSLELLVLTAERVPGLLLPGVYLVARYYCGRDQLLGVERAGTVVALDCGVHLGLRVSRLVGLVVAEAAVADQVDQNVVAKLCAECHREVDGRDAGLNIIGVDVDDRYVEALRQVGGPVS